MSAFENIRHRTQYPMPGSWMKIRTIDMHTAGEPLRVVVAGLPTLKGSSVLEYRRYMRDHHDHIRTALMFEPRGHADMYGCILTPPNDPTGDFGILFLHNEGYSTMCGHAIIAVTRLAVEMNWVEKTGPETKVSIDAPCGRISAFARIGNSGVESVYFHGVPSFVVGLDRSVGVEGIGKVGYDLAYGGAFYAYVDADELGLEVIPGNVQEHIRKGMAIKKAIMASSQPVSHPFEEDLSFLYGTIFISKKAREGGHDRNVCVFAEGEVDRSPTGSGVAGRMAIHHARGEMKPGQAPRIIESILGTRFKGSIVDEVRYGPYRAVIPKVEGTAYVVGQNEWLIDPEDPLNRGFILR